MNTEKVGKGTVISLEYSSYYMYLLSFAVGSNLARKDMVTMSTHESWTKVPANSNPQHNTVAHPSLAVALPEK